MSSAHVRRPVHFSARIVIRICNAIAEGDSLRKICADPAMPTKTSFLRWVAHMPTLQKRYEWALDMRAEHYAEQIIEISDELPAATIIDGTSVVRIDKGFAQRQRLRIDARKWTAAKLKPKKYGDRLALSDPDGKPLVTVPPVINIGFANGGPGSDPGSESDPSAEGS